ncbi:MAG: dienelactone hydrolase family protein [Solirubrobacteraceae bacterium]|nr:dienelactone hydrolase family protein [Solirubrobacteraceae bacterium]
MNPFRFGVPRLRRLPRLALAACVATSAWAAVAVPARAATGPYVVRWSEPGDLKNHTVYRPSVPAGVKMPVLVWGPSGCIGNGLAFQVAMTEIASHGIIVLASGAPLGFTGTNVSMMDRSVEWAKTQNARVGGAYYGKLIADRVAVAGHSCGGLEAYQLAAKRPEVAAVGIMNSGQITQSQTQLNQQKAPILYLLGGSGDVAYANGQRDYTRLPAGLPAFLASDNSGHFGTWFNQNGGSYAQTLKDWILYRINGNATAAKRFVGPTCGLCTTRGWSVKSKNL